MANNSTSPRAKLGYGYLHNAVDDHSRLAYTEILPGECKDTAAAFWDPRGGLVCQLRHRPHRAGVH